MQPPNRASIVDVRVGDAQLLLRRSFSDPSRPGEWDHPGGHIEPGESPEEAAVREVFEETGLRIRPDQLVFTRKLVRPKGVYWFYRADLPESAADSVKLSFEHMNYVLLSNPNWFSKYISGKDTSQMSTEQKAKGAAGNVAQRAATKAAIHVGKKQVAKMAAKKAAQTGVKQAVKAGGAGVPIAGWAVTAALMTYDAAPEAWAVAKESASLAKSELKSVREAKGVKGKIKALGHSGMAGARQYTLGGARIGAAAFVGSDTVKMAREAAAEKWGGGVKKNGLADAAVRVGGRVGGRLVGRLGGKAGGRIVMQSVGKAAAKGSGKAAAEAVSKSGSALKSGLLGIAALTGIAKGTVREGREVYEIAKGERKNPSDLQANYAEIHEMLKKMPADWRRQYNSGRRKLADAGGPVLPNSPKPEHVAQLIGITAGGNLSKDRLEGPNAVPDEVREAAMKGLRLSHAHNYGAWDFIGIARAVELATVPSVSNETKKRMKNYFTRHLKDKTSGRFGNELDPSRGYMAWLNWGGDAGFNWVNNMRKNSLRGVERQQLLLPNPPRKRPDIGPFYEVLASHPRDKFLYTGWDAQAALSAAGKAGGGKNVLVFKDGEAMDIDTFYDMIYGPGRPLHTRWYRNPYHAQGRDQWGKVCFYIYNDDGTHVVGPMGPRFCYDADKAALMVQKAEREGKRVSPSAVSPGPRPAPTGYVRERIAEHKAKPLEHNFLVGEYVIKTFAPMTGEDFYEVIEVAPSSIVIKSVGSRSITADPHGAVRVPDSSLRGADLKNGSKPFRVMLKDGVPLFESNRYPYTRAVVYKKWDGQPFNVVQPRDYN